MDELREGVKKVEGAILSTIRKWWRPATCLWMSMTMLFHGVVLPALHYFRGGGLDTDLMALAALVTSVTAAFAVREWGKTHGND